MKNYRLKLMILFISISSVFISCNNDDDELRSGISYPKAVQITYKISSTNTNNLQAISFKNESGSMTIITNVVLPYSKTINRTVNKNDDVSIGYSSINTSANVKLEILVDNTVVKSQNFNAGAGAMVYLFQ